ncbi:hypothetical protein BC826DRAFT_632360, partial [Russula brevipes]
DWETRYDATRDRCQSAQEAHTQYTSNIKLVTEHNGTSGRHVDAHARHDRQSAEYADVGQRVPPEPPPLDGTIKAKIPPQSADPDRPADCLHHAGMRVITHDAHQGNRCDPWLVPSAHASDFGDAIFTEAEQQRNATILGRSSAECADSCQAFRAAHAAMDDFRRTFDALCYQPGRTDTDNKCDEYLRDNRPHRRRAACRHGSSPSPSRALLRLASSTREDPVAGPLQPTHPFTLRAVTNPWSSVLPPAAPVDASGNTPFHTPGDAPPASSLTIDDTGDTPVAAFGTRRSKLMATRQSHPPRLRSRHPRSRPSWGSLRFSRSSVRVRSSFFFLPLARRNSTPLVTSTPTRSGLSPPGSPASLFRLAV